LFSSAPVVINLVTGDFDYAKGTDGFSPRFDQTVAVFRVMQKDGKVVVLNLIKI